MEETDVGHGEIEAGLEWFRFTHPVSERFGAQVRRTDLSGKRLAGWRHLLPDTILTLLPFVEAGVSVRVGACNPDSTNPRVVDYLARHGVEVFDGRLEPRELYVGTLWRIYAQVLMPLSLPIVGFALVLQVTYVWGDFFFTAVFAGVQNLPMTMQYYSIVGSAYGVAEYNVQMAATILTGAVPLIVYFSCGRLFARGVAVGLSTSR